MKKKHGRRSAFATVLVLTSAALLSCQGGERDPSDTKAKDEVRREIGEAYEATRDYLSKKKSDVGSEFDQRLKVLERDIEELREKAAATGEKGREKAEDTLAALKEKQDDVRKKFEEFKAAGAEMKQEAGVRLEKALEDLDAAYRKAKERYGASSG